MRKIEYTSAFMHISLVNFRCTPSRTHCILRWPRCPAYTRRMRLLCLRCICVCFHWFSRSSFHCMSAFSYCVYFSFPLAMEAIRRPASCSICLCAPSFVSEIAVRPSMAYALPIACMPYASNISFGILPRSPHRGFLPCPAPPLAAPAYSAAAFLHCSTASAPPAVLYTSHSVPYPLLIHFLVSF